MVKPFSAIQNSLDLPGVSQVNLVKEKIQSIHSRHVNF